MNHSKLATRTVGTKSQIERSVSRRSFLAASVAGGMGAAALFAKNQEDSLKKKALISITLDLEMSRHYPRRGMMEWDYQKGNLSEPTKQYSVDAARIAKERGGLIHFFCVGRVLEQKSADWLKGIAAEGHPVGNHTYDHVYVLADSPEQTQFRFQRSPWLVRGRSTKELLYDNVRLTTVAMKERAGIEPNGFRTPGGFSNGLTGREDIQQMLLDLGFTWCSAKYPAHNAGTPKQQPTAEVYDSIVNAQKNAQPFVYPTGLVEIPMSPISDVNAFRSHFWKLGSFLKAIRLGVEWAIENRACYDFLAHPSCLVVEDPKFETVKMICDIVKQAGDKAQIVGLDTIARRVQS